MKDSHKIININYLKIMTTNYLKIIINPTPMYKVEPFLVEDIFRLDLVNLDYKTENYTFSYYIHYLLNHSNDCLKIYNTNNTNNTNTNNTNTNDSIIGYIIGKHEINDNVLSGHVTALSVSSIYRNMGIASLLMKFLENNGNQKNAYFVDLFVRESNKIAIKFYEKHGYCIYRRVREYYQFPNEDAFDMRKSLDIDSEKKFMKSKVTERS